MRHWSGHQDTETKRWCLAVGSPKLPLNPEMLMIMVSVDDGSVQPVATLLNISVVGGQNVVSESLATLFLFNQLSQPTGPPPLVPPLPDT
jgi:hypothetical protein